MITKVERWMVEGGAERAPASRLDQELASGRDRNPG